MVDIDKSTLCQHRENGQVCIRMKHGEDQPHLLAPDSAASKA